MDGATVCVNEYGFYCVPDIYAKREVPKILAAGEVYEPKTLKLICQSAANGDVISGGAFVGDFLPAISRALPGKRRLYTFEPNPLSYNAALHTIALNGLENVILDPRAVGAAPATLNLQIDRPSGEAAAARARIVDDPDDGVTVPVEVTTLDDMIPKARQIAVLHLDIEGHELPALQGAGRIISESRPLIVLEAEKAWQARDLLDQINMMYPKAPYQLAGQMERNAFFLPA